MKTFYFFLIQSCMVLCFVTCTSSLIEASSSDKYEKCKSDCYIKQFERSKRDMNNAYSNPDDDAKNRKIETQKCLASCKEDVYVSKLDNSSKVSLDNSTIFMILGFLLCVFVLLVIVFKNKSSSHNRKEDNGKQCPSCAERVKEAASKCRFCGHIFSIHKNKCIESTYETKDNVTITYSKIEKKIPPNEEYKAMERAKILIKKNQYNDAIKVLSQSISTNNNQSDAYYLRAVAYSKISERKKAISDLTKSATLGNKKAIKYLQKIK